MNIMSGNKIQMIILLKDLGVSPVSIKQSNDKYPEPEDTAPILPSTMFSQRISRLGVTECKEGSSKRICPFDVDGCSHCCDLQKVQ